jgi:hypothetical protein
MEIYTASAEAKGSFVTDATLQLDEPNMQWQVFVVHRRGVACANFVTR